MTNRIAVLSLGVLTACALTVAGCKKDDPPANSANNVQPYGTTGAYGQPAYGQPGYTGQPTTGQPAYGQPGYTGQPTTGYPAGTAPAATTAAPANNPLGALGAMFPGMGGTTGGTTTGGTTTSGGGQEVANNTSMGAAGAAFLTPLQQQNAPGSHQVGETLAGNLSQGQLIKTSVQLQPGKCYTGIGQGSGGPVVVELVAQVGGMVLAAGQPALISVLGAGANCYKNPLPIAAPVFFRVTAQGTGPVTAALYEK